MVQETADGHLVVLHDLQSVLLASAPHATNAAAVAALGASVPDLDAARVKARLPNLDSTALGLASAYSLCIVCVPW